MTFNKIDIVFINQEFTCKSYIIASKSIKKGAGKPLLLMKAFRGHRQAYYC